MVALSPAACEELGIELTPEDRTRPYIEMSGRKGLGVKADDLINQLEAGALEEVKKRLDEIKKRNPQFSDADMYSAAHEIAVAALRYFLLKFTRNSVIAFDFKEALSFFGESGPYCQYAAVRINSIFRKLGDELVSDADRLLERCASDPSVETQIANVLEEDRGTETWSLLMLAQKLDENIQQCMVAAEPTSLAKYTFNLAKAFSGFYANHKMKDEPDTLKRGVWILVTRIVRTQLNTALSILGVNVPTSM
jgi:arginyl-tRNA synthetase